MSWIKPRRRWALYLRDDLTCVYCEATLAYLLPRHGALVLDHLRSRGTGGGVRRPRWTLEDALAARGSRQGFVALDQSNDATNLVTACWHCNDAKGFHSWRDFAVGHGAVERVEAAAARRITDLARALAVDWTGGRVKHGRQLGRVAPWVEWNGRNAQRLVARRPVTPEEEASAAPWLDSGSGHAPWDNLLPPYRPDPRWGF